MIKYRDLSAVDLKRNSTVQYTRTRPPSGPPLPNACPAANQVTPIGTLYSDDFHRADADDLGPNWQGYFGECFSNVLNNCANTPIRGNQIRSSANPAVRALNSPCGDITATCQLPIHAAQFIAMPVTTKDQIITAVYRGANFNPSSGGGSSAGEMIICGRMSPQSVASNGYFSVPVVNGVPAGSPWVQFYATFYQEIFNAAGVFQSSSYRVVKFVPGGFDFGFSNIVLGSQARMVSGDVLKLTIANFLLNPTLEAVCLKIFVNDVQRYSSNDFAANRMLTGGAGIAGDETSTFNACDIFYDDWTASAALPNPL